MAANGWLGNLWYCVQCDGIVRAFSEPQRVSAYFYTCSDPCTAQWRKRPEKERESVIRQRVKEGRQ